MFDVPERADFHPEGNAGEHTLLAVSALKEEATLQQILAMVLHDVGKGVTYDRYMEPLKSPKLLLNRRKLLSDMQRKVYHWLKILPKG